MRARNDGIVRPSHGQCGSKSREKKAGIGGSVGLQPHEKHTVKFQALAPALFLPVILALVFAQPTPAAGRAECRTVQSTILARKVPYCILLPPSYDEDATRRYPVLYFLHGLGENEQVLTNSGGWNLIQDWWDQKSIGEFLIVTPAAGRSFYINSRDGKVRYEDFFVREFLPFIESHYRIRADRTHRAISGVSMGGYGSLRFGFLYSRLFGSVSAHSAALVAKLPRAQLEGPVGQQLAMALGGAFGTPFDPAFWDRENPFTIVRNGPRPIGLQIYFDCGTEDDFGFNAGAQAFHDLLVSRGIPHEFHLYPGGHNEDYVAQHLHASLVFHSRAFGLISAAK
jgi:S-formylglutathione hydrolase FrmB